MWCIQRANDITSARWASLQWEQELNTNAQIQNMANTEQVQHISENPSEPNKTINNHGKITGKQTRSSAVDDNRLL